MLLPHPLNISCIFDSGYGKYISMYFVKVFKINYFLICDYSVVKLVKKTSKYCGDTKNSMSPIVSKHKKDEMLHPKNDQKKRYFPWLHFSRFFVLHCAIV